jgi:hypothetical protein
MHGSSDDGSDMHALAKALRNAGAAVYLLRLRGRANSGRSGEINDMGQRDDDLADYLLWLHNFMLLGISFCGGFVICVIASPIETQFDRSVMISFSPALSSASICSMAFPLSLSPRRPRHQNPGVRFMTGAARGKGCCAGESEDGLMDMMHITWSGIRLAF